MLRAHTQHLTLLGKSIAKAIDVCRYHRQRESLPHVKTLASTTYLHQSIWKWPLIETLITKVSGTWCNPWTRDYYRITGIIGLCFLWEESVSDINMRVQELSRRAIHRPGSELILYIKDLRHCLVKLPMQFSPIISCCPSEKINNSIIFSGDELLPKAPELLMLCSK